MVVVTLLFVPTVAVPVTTFCTLTVKLSGPSKMLSSTIGTLKLAVVAPAGMVTCWVTGAV